jgi:hypothetical protein
MWEPRRLKTLWASTACYRDSFTFFNIMIQLCAKMALVLLRSQFQATDKAHVRTRELLKFFSSAVTYGSRSVIPSHLVLNFPLQLPLWSAWRHSFWIKLKDRNFYITYKWFVWPDQTNSGASQALHWMDTGGSWALDAVSSKPDSVWNLKWNIYLESFKHSWKEAMRSFYKVVLPEDTRAERKPNHLSNSFSQFDYLLSVCYSIAMMRLLMTSHHH